MSIEFGFSHHPKWESSGGGEAFLAPLSAAGGTALEFTLYPPDDDYAALLALAERCARAGRHCSLHAPYKDPWNPEGYAGPRRAELQALFHDDFAAHAVIVRSRKAARNGQVRMAA